MAALAPLIRACPKCGTRFRVAAELLDVAEGKLRCGACLAVFDGRAQSVGRDDQPASAPAKATGADALVESVLRPPENPRPTTATERTEQVEVAARPPPAPVEPSLPERPADPKPPPAAIGGARLSFAAEGASGALEEDRRAPLPTEVRPKPPSSPQARMGARAALAASALPKTAPPAVRSDDPLESGLAAPPRPAGQAGGKERSERQRGAAGPFLGCGALFALLVFAVFGLRFDAWSLRSELRPAYEVACEVIGCRLASPNAPTAWTLHTKAVARPGPPEPLTLELELVNTAPYRQALPTVAVRFTDDGDELIAEEQSAPRDYQAERPAQRMAPGKPKALRIRFPDPGPEATRYRISLL